MSNSSDADQDILATAARLQDLKSTLRDAYWAHAEVRGLQEQLRRLIGGYAAWSADKPPTHQRARAAAAFESRFAHLLWPRFDDHA